MKSRLLLIIGIIMALGSVFIFVTIGSFDKLSTEQFSNVSSQLERVLDYCEEKKTGKDVDFIGLCIP